MTETRVVIVDDSPVLRRLLVETLGTDPQINVVGTGADAVTGLAAITELRPDIITLDVEMPGMSGIEMLIQIRKIRPQTPIIMYSHLTEKGSRITLEALCRGASDYVPKPPPGNSLDDARAHIRAELLPRIKALHHNGTHASYAPPPPRVPAKTGSARDVPPLLVAVATSTGGPNALVQLLTDLGPHFPLPLVIVQHMPPLFTPLLAERLSRETGFVVREGESGLVLRPGEGVLAPGNRHLAVTAGPGGLRVVVIDGPPENSCRPAADVLFRSVATAVGAAAIGVVMTGMGHDGLEGARQMKEKGAVILAQDEHTSVVWGMPGAVVNAGLADAVLPLAALGGEVCHRLTRIGGSR